MFSDDEMRLYDLIGVNVRLRGDISEYIRKLSDGVYIHAHIRQDILQAYYDVLPEELLRILFRRPKDLSQISSEHRIELARILNAYGVRPTRPSLRVIPRIPNDLKVFLLHKKWCYLRLRIVILDDGSIDESDEVYKKYHSIITLTKDSSIFY